MESQSKKGYVTPELKVYGSATELTRQADQANSDVPAGTPSTAYPVSPPGS